LCSAERGKIILNLYPKADAACSTKSATFSFTIGKGDPEKKACNDETDAEKKKACLSVPWSGL